MANKTIIKILAKNDLKITPQRTAVLEIIYNLNNHPSADQIVDYLRLNYPHIAIGTVYKTLDTFVKKGILNKVIARNEIMRYDAVIEKHHHLFCSESDRIEDYYDEELNSILVSYLKNKKISDFKIEDIKLQIVGKFTN